MKKNKSYDRIASSQNIINRLLAITLNGTYLSNSARVLYPFKNSVNRGIKQEINGLKKELGKFCSINQDMPIYNFISDAAKCFESMTEDMSTGTDNKRVSILKKYDKRDYAGDAMAPIRALCRYVEEKLSPFLVDAYIHGSLSTMDYTGYSDLDTLLIIKKEVFEDPDKIKDLERHFIKCTKYLYIFDHLQHHGHFILTEFDLNFYNQSFLPLSAIEQSTCIINSGKDLNIDVRDSKKESKERLLKSIYIILENIEDRKRLLKPYYLKGVLSHFMILPALYLQMNGEYVSKKKSFNIMKNRVPENKWVTMQEVSKIRDQWKQSPVVLSRFILRTAGEINPLIMPYLSRRLQSKYPVDKNLINDKLINGIIDFTHYLLGLCGIDGNRNISRKNQIH